MWVASGSAERILLVWDAHTGALAAGPFTGHTGRRNWISSVCFSPDGTQIASGSSDKTVRVCKVGPRRSQHNAFTRIDAAPENSWEELYTFNPESGWVRNTEGGLILWVPPWLREGFYLPHNTVVLSPKGTTKVDYSCFVHGTEWVKCFGPEFANTGSI
ncbi:hypothetical protein DFH06DRAFT_985856 [Mycena polygramma]|nr:hypothetical protein DFH06DRAFT_985856 [Mycena polygramma]